MRRNLKGQRDKTIKRWAPIKKRSRPRINRLVDRDYMAWLATQPPLVSGAGRITIHHVRRCGEMKNDRRTVPLPSSMHFIQENSYDSVEAMKKTFEAHHGVDFELAIVRYNAQYQQETGIVWA
jgi:hypothetical protein